MKTPPLLLLAALAFWGWQSGFLLAGLLLGVGLESARLIQARWDFTEEDFRRIWNFCVLLALALIVYSFAANQDENGFTGLLHSSAAGATRRLGVSGSMFLRWLPMTLFLFVAAQMFSERESIPLSAISLIVRRRMTSAPAERFINISYPYFIVCVFSAGIHPNEGTESYFWGQAGLLAWALWPLRSRRFGLIAWLVALGLGVGLGFSGQRGLGELERVLEGYNAQWMAGFFHGVSARGKLSQLPFAKSNLVCRRVAKGFYGPFPRGRQ